MNRYQIGRFRCAVEYYPSLGEILFYSEDEDWDDYEPDDDFMLGYVFDDSGLSFFTNSDDLELIGMPWVMV